MLKKALCLALVLGSQIVWAQTSDYFEATYGELLPGSTKQVGLWWASSGWKIGQDKPRAARNEAEAAQLVVRPSVSLSGFTAHADSLTGPNGAIIPADCVEILEVRYVNVVRPTDKSSKPGPWPDPLPP